MTKFRGRLLLAGNWQWDIYEQALARGFEGHGWEVIPFRTAGIEGMPAENSLLGRARPAWSLSAVNRALLHEATEVQPDLVFLWRCIDILPATLRAMRAQLAGVPIIGYHNDNPFKGLKARLKSRHFLAGLRDVDVAAVYRPDNLKAALALGAPRAELLPPSYIRSLHRPIEVGAMADVVYVGHYEPDGRLKALQALRNAGVTVKVRGTRWHAVQLQHRWLAEQPIEQLWGDDYVTAIASARISLAFLSGRHGDVYTRRCFEIPACGSLLMAPRTRELKTFFREDEEAVFWSTHEELVEKVKFLLSHEEYRATIAAAGRQRVLQDGHDEYGRASQILRWFEWGHGQRRNVKEGALP